MSRSFALGALGAGLLLGGLVQAQQTITVPSAAAKVRGSAAPAAPVQDQIVTTPPPQQQAEGSRTARPGDGAEPTRGGTDVSARSAPAATAPVARSPILGRWRWSSKDGRCTEQHEYRADGTATVHSGGEVLQKTYTIERYKGGPYYLVHEQVTASNGGKDCTGSVTAVGKQSGLFVLPTNDGGYYTCSSDEGWGCFGTAGRARDPVRND